MGQKILIVDDSRTVCQAVKYAFTASPFSVDSVATAADAMRMLRTGDYSAAIVDYALPDGPGVQLLRLVRTEASLVRLPIVFLTGNYHPVNLDEVMSAGADVTLAKPFKTDDLLAKVNDAILAAPSRPLAVPKQVSSPVIPVIPIAHAAPAPPPFTPAPAAAADEDDDFEIVTTEEPPARAPLAPPAQASAPVPRHAAPLPPPPMAGGFRRVPPPPSPEPVRRMPLAPPPPAPIRGAGAPPLVPSTPQRRPLAETAENHATPEPLSMQPEAAPAQEAGVFRTASPRTITSVDEVPNPRVESSRPSDGTPITNEAVPSTNPPGGFERIDTGASAPATLPVEVRPAPAVIAPAPEPAPIATLPDDEDDFAPADPVAAAELPPITAPVTSHAAPAAAAVSIEDIRAAVAAKLDEEMVRNLIKELLPGIVKEYLGVMLRQTGAKLESYSTQKIDAFVENDLNVLARAAIDKYLENLQ